MKVKQKEVRVSEQIRIFVLLRRLYTACSTAEGCIYCGHQKLEKMDKLEPEESEGLEC